jgi:hypothetical protein
MSSSSSNARLRTRNESRETRVDRIVIMHRDGMTVVPETPQSLSTVHSFQQGQPAEHLRFSSMHPHERKLERAGASALIDLTIVALAISFAFVAHLIEIALWAVLLVICGEFQEFGSAYYCSAVNYTTLGYGDLLLTPSWRLLGPLEAANGMLMFGVSTAMVFAVMQRLILVRFEDLRY